MTLYDCNVKRLRKFVLYYISEPQKSNMAVTRTQLTDQKLNVGAYFTLGELQQALLLKHMVRTYKKVQCCSWIKCQSTLNFTPNLKIRAIMTNQPIILRN